MERDIDVMLLRGGSRGNQATEPGFAGLGRQVGVHHARREREVAGDRNVETDGAIDAVGRADLDVGVLHFEAVGGVGITNTDADLGKSGGADERHRNEDE